MVEMTKLPGTVLELVDGIEWAEMRAHGIEIVTVAKSGDPGTAHYICSEYTTDYECVQAAINYAIANSIGIVHINEGHYYFTNHFEFAAGNICIEGDGANTILDFSAVANHKYITFTGSITTINSLLASNVAAGDMTVTLASGEGTKYAANDWIRIRSDAIFQPTVTGEGWFHHLGEIQQIKSVSGDTLTLQQPLYGGYLTSDVATIDKMNMLENITCRNFSIVSTEADNTGYGIRIMQAINVEVSNIRCTNVQDHCIYFVDVVRGKCLFCHATRANRSDLGYGFCVANASREIIGIGNDFSNCRHGILCSGDHTYGIQYNQTYIANVQVYDEKNAGMFGPHPCYDGMTVVGNICEGSGLGAFNGLNNTIVGNTIRNVKDAIFGGIVVVRAGGETLISDNTITTINNHGIYVTAEYPGITIQNNKITCAGSATYGIYTDNNVKDLVITDNTINSEDDSIYIRNVAYSAPSYNLDCKNNTLTSSAGHGIRVQSDNDIHNINVLGNTVYVNAGSRGIYISRNATATCMNYRAVVDNNIVYGGDYGISISTITGASVNHNHVYDSATGLSISPTVVNYTARDNEFVGVTTAITDAGTGSKLLVGNIKDYVVIT